MGLFKEFRDFAVKGNAIDMAVGIIIGAAFGKIVSSLVKDVIMPPIGMLLGKVDFSNLAIELQAGKAAVGDQKAVEPVLLKYGAFIQEVINFIIVAFVIFMMVRAINSAKKKEEAKPDPKPSDEVLLLTEIRDNLKK